MKRLIDIAGSLFGLLLLSPVMLVAAIAIHRHMGEPVLFVQERPGLRGRPFRMYKFRSEEHTSELQSLMRISYAVFCLKQKKSQLTTQNYIDHVKKQQY